MQSIIVSLVFLCAVLSPEDLQQLAPGMEHCIIRATRPEYFDTLKINVIRIDPHKWELVFASVNRDKTSTMKTLREWCREENLTAAINAGMYNDDNRTHTGYVRDGDHVNSSHKNSYKSLLAFNPKPGKAVAPAKIFDLDEPGVTIEKVLGDYGTVIQNLRLIKRPGINVWSQRQEYWSEAALAEDKKGRILFLFSETPVTMHDFNEILLSSGLEIIAAQHLEGNAPAQFYLKTGETEINLSGGNGGGWPLPNIIGIHMKTPPK